MYKVMLIDDEVYIREGMKQIIPWRALGCEVIGEAQNGQEGIEKVVQLNPDIIISDIRMPKKDGLEMIDELKSINQKIQVIILTGYREFEYAQQAIRLGVLRFLLKPSKMDELIEAITQAVENLKEESKKELQIQERIIDSKDDLEKDSGKTQYIVKQAIEYIDKHYREKLDLQTVADSLYVSTWHLCKILKKQTGTNFVELLNKARIEAAKRELLETNKKIYEIAEIVGYTDTAYFSKMFKKITQATPNEFRNKM